MAILHVTTSVTLGCLTTGQHFAGDGCDQGDRQFENGLGVEGNHGYLQKVDEKKPGLGMRAGMAGDTELLLRVCLRIVAESPPQVDATANQIGNNQCFKCQRQHGNHDRHST